jgi:stage III sporulation protein AA
MEQIIRLFPVALRDSIRKSGIFDRQLEEIRIRVNEPLMFTTAKGDFFLKESQLVQQVDAQCCKMNAEDIRQMSMFLSRYSLYAYEEEMKKGFLTVEGGHRVGICGQVSCEDGKIRRIHPVCYLNIRVAREQKGCAAAIFPSLMENRFFQNTLILSAPGIGKTTLLRDIVRLLSNGSKQCAGVRVGLVDERSEIAGALDGIPQNDVGMRTDVLDGCPKVEGMLLLIRSMSPQVLAVDEIGGEEDMHALQYAMRCGCQVVATIHSRNLEELFAKPKWKRYHREGLFARYVVLERTMGQRKFSVYSAALERLC